MDWFGIALIASIIILVFLIARVFNNWYWRINEIVERLENIESAINEQGEGINNKLTNICENGIKIRENSDFNTII